MGIWKDLYGPRSRDFIDGARAGVEMYATWKDGRKVVAQRPISNVIREIEEDLGGMQEEIKEEKKEEEGETKKKKPNCYECVYREGLIGSVHSKCVHPKIKYLSDDPLANLFGMMANTGRISPLVPPENPLNIKGSPHGIKNGWFNWPVNFDPVWLVSCDGFYPKNLPPSCFDEFPKEKKDENV